MWVTVRGVPALGEHRDRHHAAGGAAEPARHADGVHCFAQQVLVREAFGLAAVAGARDDLAAEALDLVARGDPEVPAESFPGVELLAVDQQRVRSGERVAVFVEVAKQLQPSVLERRGAVLMLAMKPGDVVVEQFRGGRVVAHDDEARRRLNARFAPLVEDLLVVAIERFEGGLQPCGNAQRVEQLRTWRAPFVASSCRCAPTGSETWASRHWGYCPPPAHAAA